ncbi:MAG: MmgE/PrpD family protein [Rubrivivax sp.]|nr:MmgE/PrpD family protein [Rubrivivax sp.]
MDEVAASLSERLAHYWAGARFEDLPAEVVHAGKRFLLDTVAAGAAGGRTEVVDTVTAAMRAGGSGDGDALLWGREGTLAPAAAALINGTAAHALELDDFGGCGHSGAVVIPAVCALAQRHHISGREALLAIAAGYDVAGRVLEGSGGYRPHNERGWHSTGTCGSYGAAAASAKLLRAPCREFAHALGIAGTFTGGTWAFLADGALVKRFHPGKAAETGVSAALLARAGLTGPRQILDAAWGGFYPTYAPGVATPERAVPGWARLSSCARASSPRLLPHDSFVHRCGAGDRRFRAGRAASITAMIVHGNEQTQRQFSRTDIRNLLEAQFSMPYCLAVTADSGRATLDQFEPLRTADPEIRRLMAITEIRADRVLSANDYPSLEVVFTDGSRRLRDVPFAKGAPEAPVSDAELAEKASGLLAGAVGAQTAQRIVEMAWQLDRLDDFSKFTSLLGRAAGHRTDRGKRARLMRYIVSRLIWGAIIVLLILVLNFLVIHMVPGDPLHALLGDFPVPPGYAEQVRADFGLDQPLATQLGLYLLNLVQGNLGFSFANRMPVLDLILGRLGPAMLLMVPALFFAAVFGVMLGVAAAPRAGSVQDSALRDLAVRLFGADLLAGPDADHRVRDPSGLVSRAGHAQHARGAARPGCGAQRDPAPGLARLQRDDLLHRHRVARGARQRGRGAASRLCAHRQGQGPVAPYHPVAPCAAQCADPGGDRDRLQLRPFADRRHPGGDGVRLARHRQPVHHIDHQSRLSGVARNLSGGGGIGGDHQHADRSAVCLPRSPRAEQPCKERVSSCAAWRSAAAAWPRACSSRCCW